MRRNSAATSVTAGGTQGWVIEIGPRRKISSPAIARPQQSTSGVSSKTRRFIVTGIQARLSRREKRSERFCPFQKRGDLAAEDDVIARQRIVRAAQAVDDPAHEERDDDEDEEMACVAVFRPAEAVRRQEEIPQADGTEDQRPSRECPAAECATGDNRDDEAEIRDVDSEGGKSFG